jgi:hypothetical protein
MVRCGAGKRSNALSWIGLVGQEQSECKHTHRHVLRLDCLWKGVGTFAMLPHGKDEKGRVRKGNWDSDGLLECSEYTLCYLNTLAHSAYMLVGQAQIFLSCARIVQVAPMPFWLPGVPGGCEGFQDL